VSGWEAAGALVALLADEGVDHLFINPGTDTAPVQEALAAARAARAPHPQTVLCIHEHVALSAAIGHHMASGRPQSVMVHVDAGTLNLGGALHNAQRNRTPVVVFAGRAPYSPAPDVRGHRDSPIHWQQEQLDQAAVMRAYGKWAMEVPRGRELAPIARRAFQVAQAPPSGLAYVMLPREALMEPAPADLPRRLPPPSPAAPDPAALDRVADALAEAERPVVITARSGVHPENVATLVRIAELLGAPVVDQRDHLSFPGRHPLAAGPGGEGPLRQADVVLLVDVEVPWVPAVAAPPAGATVLQLDVDPAKPTMPLWTFPVDVAVTADSRLALPALEEALRGRAAPARLAAWQARRAEVERGIASGRSGRPQDVPEAVLAAVDRALPHDAVVLCEAVTSRLAAVRQIDRAPGRFFQTGSPALGWALGAAIGVKLARPAAPVLALVGDGSFNFGVPTAALWSARRMQAPFVTLILNNHSYYASKRPVQTLYPEGAAALADDFPEADLSPELDYVTLARACGGDGRVVSAPDEVGEALRWAFGLAADGCCVVLDVRLPRP
jgi:acetolactate synthase I/II/III large subunit